VRNRRLGNEPEAVTGSDGRSTRSRTVLETTHIGASDGSNPRIGLVVLGLSDGCPFRCFGDAIQDELGEAVLQMSAHIFRVYLNELTMSLRCGGKDRKG
jgi:hypothetical protein